MDSTPLSVLLSQALVAFAIEFDNEFESRMTKTWARPFRVSIVMWSNFMRFVREEGTRFGEIVSASRIPKNAVASVVGGMERWKYITVDHDPANGVPPRRTGFGSARGIRDDTIIYPSMVGKLALDIWRPLVDEIEGRWKSRLGDAQVENLRDALRGVHSGIRLVMPYFLPVVGGGGLFAHPELDEGTSEPEDTLPTLASRVLLGFTLDYEERFPFSIAIGSNVLRVLDGEGTRVKDLPLTAGVSKEAVSVSMTWTENAGYITVEPDPSARGKVVRLTQAGADAQTEHTRRLDEIEALWEERFGQDAVGALRSSLQEILDRPGGEGGPLSAGLVTPPGGWRGTGRYKPLTAAFIKSPANLPHYPMVLHRGGWPDGS
jgi:DNA-binding MarR family transcriptional regulator